MSDEKGLRFETGLIVILVLFVACLGVILGFQGVSSKIDSIDARLHRVEKVMFQGAPPTARRPEKYGGGT